MHLAGLTRLGALLDEHSGESRLARAKGLCTLCADVTGTSGAALSITGRALSSLNSTVCGSDALSIRLEELQLALTEGPIGDALDGHTIVLAPDLADASDRRWLWFAPAAVDAGAGALFVVPLQAGSTWIGALSLYRKTAGGLSRQQIDDLDLLAGAATSILVSVDTEPADGPGHWAVGAESCFQAGIYQAVGMLGVRLNLDAGQALARLRMHAYVVDHSIGEVADEIVAGRLQLEADAA